jgi:hypothetical protein
LSDDREAARAQAAAILVQRAQQAVAGVPDMFGCFLRCLFRFMASNEAEDAPVLGPGLLA